MREKLNIIKKWIQAQHKEQAYKKNDKRILLEGTYCNQLWVISYIQCRKTIKKSDNVVSVQQ